MCLLIFTYVLCSSPHPFIYILRNFPLYSTQFVLNETLRHPPPLCFCSILEFIHLNLSVRFTQIISYGRCRLLLLCYCLYIMYRRSRVVGGGDGTEGLEKGSLTWVNRVQRVCTFERPLYWYLYLYDSYYLFTTANLLYLVLFVSEGPVLGEGGGGGSEGGGMGLRAWWGGVRVPNTGGLLGSLNSDPVLYAKNLLNSLINDDEAAGQFFSTNIDSNYSDVNSFRASYSNSTSPIFLSLNIQSLQSKFADLKHFLSELSNSKISIDLIIIQETWNINYPELLVIPEYQNLVYKTRSGMRGGGWYICTQRIKL